MCFSASRRRTRRGIAAWKRCARSCSPMMKPSPPIARNTLETDDRALIYVRNFGYRHGPADVLARLAAGEPVDPSLYYMRTTPRFETGAERYRWLNRLICVATGARRAASVELEIFEVK